MRLVPPLGSFTRMRCRLGRNLRGVTLVTCVPMPPLFLLCPLRLMMLPLVGRLPVIAQILAMTSVVKRVASKGFEPAEARGISNIFCPPYAMEDLEFLSQICRVNQLHKRHLACAQPGSFGFHGGLQEGRGVAHKEGFLGFNQGRFESG